MEIQNAKCKIQNTKYKIQIQIHKYDPAAVLCNGFAMCPSVSGFMIFNSTRHVFCELCIFYSHDIIISRAKYKKCIFSTLRTSHACQVQMFHRCFKKLQLLEVLQLLLEFLQCDLKSCYDLTLSVVFHYMYNILASTTPGCIFWI